MFIHNSLHYFFRSPPKIPEVHIPEDPLLQLASGLRIEINRGFSSLHEIASGRDLKKFLSVSFKPVLSMSHRDYKFITLLSVIKLGSVRVVDSINLGWML